MKQIAIFGGSFNPPHLGHRQVVTEVLARALVEEIWLLPVGNHAFAKTLAPAKNRVEMLKILIQNLSETEQKKVKICDYELGQPLSITYQTLQYLRATFPDDNFVFLMGGDQLSSFTQWRDYQKLAREFDILVYPRIFAGGENSPTTPTHEQIAAEQKLCQQYGLKFLTDFPAIEISSTQAREFVNDSQKLINLVGPEIATYIHDQKLYQNSIYMVYKRYKKAPESRFGRK